MDKYTKDQFFDENKKISGNLMGDYAEELAQMFPDLVDIPDVEELFEKLKEMDLWYSNHAVIQIIMERLVEQADEKLKIELQKVFIGVKMNDTDPLPNAIARIIDPEYKGYLITLNFEIGYVLSIIAGLTATIVSTATTEDESDRKILGELLDLKVAALPEKSEEALIYNGKLPLHLLTQELDNYGNVIEGMLTFVIAHEIGHHFLKHTEHSGEDMFPFGGHNIRGGNIYHEEEYLADEFALDLMLNNNQNTYLPYNYMGGPLYTMIALALRDKFPHQGDEEHPSTRERYLNIKRELMEYCTDEEYKHVMFFVDHVLLIIHDISNPWKGNKWWE
ncbi:hypothetical protein [Bacillus mycoides]|uniref:hypothetical protein n=1 Tax=Bacillus mycoides TaxID=1405 RepID=UPI000B4BAD31|nr:hypothetical protein [Bacillus mycoides]